MTVKYNVTGTKRKELVQLIAKEHRALPMRLIISP